MNIQENFIIVTGGPGAGKTTLLQELANCGYPIIAEDARRIIQQQAYTGGQGLPWKDKELFLRLMLEASVQTYKTAQQDYPEVICFFDRGIIDSLCYAELIGSGISPELNGVARSNVYHPVVFLLPPWKEIYQTDTERKQTWAEVEETYRQIQKQYMHYGYQVVELPKDNIENRRDFVLQHLNTH